MSEKTKVTDVKKVEKSKKDWNIMEFCVPITEAHSSGKDFIIKGVAINETTTRNGITYVAEELSKAAASFRNKPILKDHDPMIDNIVGRTTENVVWNETNKRIDFEARIVDEDIKSKIESGLITDVSIGAKVVDIIEDKKAGTLTAIGIEGLEISLVAVPGDPGANIANAMHESFTLKEHLTTKFNKEVNQMTNEETTPAEEVADKEEVSPVESEETSSESETSEKLKVATEKLAKYEAKEKEAAFSKRVSEEVAKQLKAAKEDTEVDAPAEEEKPAEEDKKEDGEDSTEVEDKSSSEEPMEDKTTGDVADKAEPEEASTESMTLEDAETGKGFAIYREYSRDDSGKLHRLVRF